MSNKNRMNALAALGCCLLAAGCAKKGNLAAGAGEKAGGAISSLGAGNVSLQKMTVTQGQEVSLNFKLNKSGAASASRLLSSMKVESSEVAQGDVEISVLGPDGVEVKFDRTSPDAIDTSFVPPSDGEYTVVVRNNTPDEGDFELGEASGADEVDDIVAANQGDEALHKDITLKSFVAFARQCKKLSDDGNSVVTVQAPENSYFVQPFVFLGKVGPDKKVTEISTASVSISSGGKTLQLKKLSEMDYDAYREIGGLTEAQHQVYTRNFYQGYFGAAGEMYTVDTFAMGGDCDVSQVFDLGVDPGNTQVLLQVVDNSISPALNESIEVKATVQPPFSMYTSAGVKLSDWTQCTYNRSNGEPKTYNGDAESCKQFSLSDLPYVKLDYLLPSQYGNAVTTEESDPTRIIFYGHSVQRNLWVEIAKHSSELISAEKPSLTLQGCLNNGGLVGVPIGTEETYLPLGQLNAQIGDVINLARRPGSYTGLTKFYQGNVDLSGKVDLPTCITNGTESCAEYKVVSIQLEGCSIKADSGVASASISDTFVYPSYFEMSGVITE